MLISIVIIIALFIMINYFSPDDMVYVVSDVNNKPYLVRDLPDKQLAANMIGRIHQNIITITDYLFNNINNYKTHSAHITELKNRIGDTIIQESSHNTIYTSYSVNKGEQLVFCLRSRNNKNILHDMNLLMYVVLHEISHIACPEYGHTPLFREIFAFIAKEAESINLYKKIPFNTQHTEYCGLTITESII